MDEDSVARASGRRGTELILFHCGALSAAPELRLSASHRLQEAAGPELARLLVSALAARRGDQRLAA